MLSTKTEEPRMKITCLCGSVIFPEGLSRHRKTKLHLDRMQLPEEERLDYTPYLYKKKRPVCESVRVCRMKASDCNEAELILKRAYNRENTRKCRALQKAKREQVSDE